MHKMELFATQKKAKQKKNLENSMKQASLLFPPPNPNSSLLLLLLLLSTQVARSFDKFLNVVVSFRTRYVYDLRLQSKSVSRRITPNHTPKNLSQFYATHFWSFNNRNQQAHHPSSCA